MDGYEMSKIRKRLDNDALYPNVKNIGKQEKKSLIEKNAKRPGSSQNKNSDKSENERASNQSSA